MTETIVLRITFDPERVRAETKLDLDADDDIGQVLLNEIITTFDSTNTPTTITDVAEEHPTNG